MREIERKIQKQYLVDILNVIMSDLDKSYVKPECRNGYIANYLLNRGFCFEKELLKSFVERFKRIIPLKSHYSETTNQLLEVVHNALDDYVVEFLEQENK